VGKTKEQEKSKNPRGLFEKPPGSGVWWINYFDAQHKRRREKIGSKSNALKMRDIRKAQAHEGIKMPENLRARPVTVGQLAEDALVYSKANKPRSHRDDKSRMKAIKTAFQDREAEDIRPLDIEQWLASHEEWATATKNRYLALLKLLFRLGEVNGKIKTNAARLVRMRQENNAIVRYLNQHDPLPTKLPYLRRHRDEESRLRAVITKRFSRHMPELDIALNTGMRRGEQYGLVWANVNLENRVLTIPQSKSGKPRHIPLNALAVETFRGLLPNMAKNNRVFISTKRRSALESNRHWFGRAIAEAGIRDFTWHCLRHTFASRLVMAGVDLSTVRELMGHGTIGMTARYAHLAPKHTSDAIEKLTAYAPEFRVAVGRR
jgi:integrase